MNFLKKLKRWFSLEKKEISNESEKAQVACGASEQSFASMLPNETEKSQKGQGKVVLEMGYNIVHPKDLLEPLLMAIASCSLHAEVAKVMDIRLYSLYDRDDNSFLGSFYALERDNGFYGNIVGRQEIYFLRKEAFCYKETEELFVPLSTGEGKVVALMCKYNRKKALLTAMYLKKTDLSMQNEEILHKFEKGTSFDEALAFYRKKA